MLTSQSILALAVASAFASGSNLTVEEVTKIPVLQNFARVTAASSITGAVAIILGLILCFLGTRLVVLFSAVVGFISGAILGVVALTVFKHEADPKDWVTILVVAMVAIAMTVLCIYLWRVAVYLAAALAGLCVSFLLYPFVQSYLRDVPVWAVQVTLALIFVVFTYLFEDFVLVCITSFVGASIAVYGADLYAGRGFSKAINDAIQTQQSSVFTKTVLSVDAQHAKAPFVMLIAVAVMTLLGIVFQMNTKPEKKKDAILRR